MGDMTIGRVAKAVAQAGSVRAFVNRYSAERIPDEFDIRYIPYDWTIANARGPKHAGY